VTALTTIDIHPDYRAMLEAGGLASFDALFAAGERGRVDGHATRSVSRVELAGPDGKPVAIFIKRQWGDAAAASWKDLLRLRFPMPAARREWRNMRRLIRAGVPVAVPVAWGYSDDGAQSRSLLATREAAGVSLARWIQDASPADADRARERRTVADAVGAAVRRLHGAGFSFPDLYAKHLYIERHRGGAPRIVLIDVQRLRRFLPWLAAEDLAALYVSAEALGVTPRDRLRVLRAYSAERRLGDEARGLARRIRRLAERMPGRGQDPNLLESRRSAPPGMVPPCEERKTTVDAGRLKINEAFRPALEAAGLMTLDAIMAMPGGEVFRDVPGRSTVRIELPDPPAGRSPTAGGGPAGGTRALFVKRYTAVPWRTKLRRTFSLNRPVSLAGAEVRALVRVVSAGIATVRRVAVGEELSRGGRSERSCIVTEEIAGATQADKFCEAAFGGARSPEKTAEKRRLILAVARLARRLHAARLSHRDFYLCHILVRPVAGGEPILYLIDLQRVTHHRRGIGRRWIVKDLGALLFSSRPSAATFIRSAVFTRTDAVRFAREYFAVPRLGQEHKAILRSIIRKARRIAGHEARRRRQEARE
jgi:heptose I phosphotransferase